jgi:hypothetical protein
MGVIGRVEGAYYHVAYLRAQDGSREGEGGGKSACLQQTETDSPCSSHNSEAIRAPELPLAKVAAPRIARAGELWVISRSALYSLNFGKAQ